MNDSALLALEDGTTFLGTAVGYPGHTTGELIFNTATSGYQEIITDPSYAQQIVTFTYPHIGNVGTNQEDCESDNHYAAGIVIRDLSITTSSWRSEQSLPDFLREKRIVGIAGIDTRQLTHILREQGAQRACITHNVTQPELAIQAAKDCPSLVGMDLAKQVSTSKTYHLGAPDARYHIVAYDFGVKKNILHLLVDRQARVTVVPAQTPVEEVLAMQPDGVFLSNGPGDPAACDYAIAAVPLLLQQAVPLFGICLGHQLLALGCGGKTIKMKFGHHGANHPVTALATRNQVLITSQNHGFAVDEASLPADVEVTHRSLFDGSVQGIRHKTQPAFGFQGHPEASPGPHDAQNLFDQFIQLIEQKHHA